MRLVGLMPVHSEDWVLGFSARVALKWVDHLVVLDHASSDRTGEILEDLQAEFPGGVTVLRETSLEWDEMEHRQRMLVAARAQHATHIALIDADEILTANLLPKIRWHVEQTPEDGWLMQLPIYNCRGAVDRYHSTGIWATRWGAAAFTDHPRLCWEGNQFHHREPFNAARGIHQPVKQGGGGILHLWGASERRLLAKVVHYKIVERIRWPEKFVVDIEQMYNWAIDEAATAAYAGAWKFATAPTSWLAPYRDLMDQYLNLDAEPWQTAEAQRLFDLHGADYFRGLNLFGLVNTPIAA